MRPQEVQQYLDGIDKRKETEEENDKKGNLKQLKNK